MTTKVVSADRTIAAPAAAIFDILADPEMHAEFDGEETVRGVRASTPKRLSMGARFAMNMKLGVPYLIGNEVVEFEEGRRIAWRHFGHHVWRYELEPIDDSTTLVTESFDWSVARLPHKLYELVGYPAKHKIGMAKSLERLEALVAPPQETDTAG